MRQLEALVRALFLTAQVRLLLKELPGNHQGHRVLWGPLPLLLPPRPETPVRPTRGSSASVSLLSCLLSLVNTENKPPASLGPLLAAPPSTRRTDSQETLGFQAARPPVRLGSSSHPGGQSDPVPCATVTVTGDRGSSKGLGSVNPPDREAQLKAPVAFGKQRAVTALNPTAAESWGPEGVRQQAITHGH